MQKFDRQSVRHPKYLLDAGLTSDKTSILDLEPRQLSILRRADLRNVGQVCVAIMTKAMLDSPTTSGQWQVVGAPVRSACSSKCAFWSCFCPPPPTPSTPHEPLACALVDCLICL